MKTRNPLSLSVLLCGVPLLASAVVAATPARTVNIQFCTAANPVKTGPAAVGNDGDVWNRSVRGEAGGGYLPFNELADLQWADGTLSPIDLTITNAAGAWANGIPDAMMASFLYPLPNGNGSIRLWLDSVPAGHYDLFLYGRGATDDQVGVFGVESRLRSLGVQSVTVGSGWQSLPIRESVHYVVFRKVPSDGVSPIAITVSPSPHGEAILNGLQLVQVDIEAPPAPLMFELLPDSGLPSMGGDCPGAAWGDFDGDGDPDLVLTSYSGTSRLVRNLGNARFEEVSGALADSGSSAHGCSWGDYDGDGRLDLLIAKRGGQPSAIYRNAGEGTFLRLSGAALPAGGGDAVGLAWGGLNRDGRLDAFLTDLSGRNRLWRQSSAGVFTQVDDSPVAETQVGVGCAWGDYDNDGDLDLFVANGGNRDNSLFRNDAGIFVKVSAGEIVSNAGYSVGAAWGDYDNDGDLDLYVANRLGPNFLYRNDGGDGFTRIFDGAPVPEEADSNGCTWADYDNDGDLDLFIASFKSSALFLYQNQGGGIFTRVLDEVPTQPGAHGNSVVLADCDANGFLDVLVTKWGGGSTELFRNLGNANHWLRVKVAGPAAGRSAIGARVRVKTIVGGVERWQLREVTAFDGWGGTDADPHFGLGAATVAAKVVVTWPSGESLELTDVPADQVLAVGTPAPLLAVTPAGGPFNGQVVVTMTTSSSDGEIRYTTDGSEPVEASTVYHGALTLTQSTTLKARVFVGGQPMSPVQSYEFVRNTTPPADPFSLVADSAAGVQTGSWMAVDWGDYDRDGDLDLAAVTYGQGNHLFRNDGGILTQVAAALPEIGASTAVAWVDVDGDGDLDLFITNSGQDHFLYQNDGQGAFVRNTTAEITATTGECYGAAWGDYDRDGQPDVMIIGAWKPNLLFHNDGNSRFTRITEGAIVNDSAAWVGGTWGDFDGDGWPDFTAISGGDAQSNALYRNNQDGTFTRFTTGSVVTDGGAGTSASWGDYDNDGDLDLVVANRSGAQFLYRNDGAGQFVRITTGVIVNDGGESNSSVWLDYDNDGWLDLFVGNYQGGQNFLYHNQGDGTFVRVLSGPGAAATETVGVAAADYSGDGYPDLMLAGYGTVNSLYRNNGGPNHWLIVKCVGTRSNTGAIGATVRVTANLSGTTRTQMREITGGGGWASSGPRAEFGLASATVADLVRIEWPSGIVTELRNVPADQVLTVVEQPPPLEIVPAGGYFATTVEVALRSTVEGGTIHLTLDGTGPSVDSPAYAPPLTLATSTRVTARVFQDGAPASDVVSALFLQSQWNDGLPVAWRERYFGPAWFTKPEALALEDGDEDGANVYAEWLAGTSPVDGASKPGEGSLLTLAPATGEFEVVGYISAASFIPGGIVRYTLDGTDPGPASPMVEGGVIALTQTATVKARVFVNGNPVTALVSGSYTIRDIAPRITAQPAGRTVTEGGTTRFTVGVLGTAPLSYQWLHGGVDVAGATGAEFPIQPVGLGDAGDYTVRVSNPLGSVVSEVAKLTVIPKPQPPKIVRQPLHQSVVVGSPLTIAVEVTGTEPLSYAWYRNGFRITTATNGPSYTIPAVKLTDAANYWVRVTSPQGQATSSQARITVTEAAVAAAITTHPVGGNVPEGGDQALSVAATGTTPLAYQWFFNGQAIAGATTSELRLTGLTAVQAGTYWVSVSNLAGGAVSAPAVVQVTPAQPGGTVNLANLVSGVVDAPVFDRDGVTPLAGTAFLAQLFAGPTAGELAPVGGAVPFRTPGDGYVVSPNVITVTAVTPGAVAFVQMRVWESARGASYEAARLAGSSVGVSETLSVTTGGGGSPPAPPADLAGLKSFQLARETESPVVLITSPAAGNTADDRFTLAGSITDNVAVAGASWSWNDRDMGSLPLADGAFAVPGLRLASGENRFVVRATDTAGNAAEATGVAVFEPVRVLAVAAAGPVREGRRLATDLVFTSPGGVSGLTFVLRYDAARFRDPELAWAEAAVLAGALTQVNLNTPGELRATLSLPGGEFPAGPFALGVISLRARSVPAITDTLLVPELVDLADRTGTPLTFGNAVVAAAAQITPRRLGGDNNGNDLLDVGDAALIQRFVALLEPPQSWDVTGNDLNENLALDSGDVVKVLRVVVGLDPAPVVPTRSGGTHRSPIPHGAVPVTAAALSASAASAWPGSQVTVRVALTGAPADLSGAALTLRYPPDRMRVSGADGPRAGAAVPAGVSSMFNVDPAAGTIRFAASGTQSWPDSGEPVLEVTFDLLAGASPAGWPVALSAGEVAWDDGYEVQALGPVELVITNLAPQIEPALAIADGAVTFRFPTEAGLNYAIQTSTDLESWEPLGQVTGTGAVLGFPHEGAGQEPLRFYRIVVTGN